MEAVEKLKRLQGLPGGSIINYMYEGGENLHTLLHGYIRLT